MADQAFEAATKAGSKIKNTAFESILKLGGSMSGISLLDTIAKINKLRRDVPVNIADQKKAWKKTDPLTLDDLKKTGKGLRKLPIVSTATLPWAYSDARKALKDQKYTGTMNTVERINDDVNMGGVGTQGAGAATSAPEPRRAPPASARSPACRRWPSAGPSIAVGEGVQLVSLGADVGMIVVGQEEIRREGMAMGEPAGLDDELPLVTQRDFSLDELVALAGFFDLETFPGVDASPLEGTREAAVRDRASATWSPAGRSPTTMTASCRSARPRR